MWKCVPTSYVYCHCYSDRKLADDEYYIVSLRDSGGENQYLHICIDFVDGGASLAWKKGVKANNPSGGKEKEEKKSDLRTAVKSKRAWNS